MAHAFIVGASGSGKSRLAKWMAEQRRGNGARQIAYDPLLSRWPSGVIVLDDFEAAWGEVRDAATRGCSSHFYIDEADTVFSARQPENIAVALRGRHFGADLNIITQRPTLVVPAVRGQCETLYCFTVPATAARMLGDDYCSSVVAEHAPKLKQGEWLWVRWDNGVRITTRRRLP